MMTVYIKLETAGADTGPFNLYSDVDGYITPFEIDIIRQSLVDGYLSILVPDGTTKIKIVSINENCNNFIILDIITTGTTTSTTSTSSTSTTTSTTTPEPPEYFTLQYFVYEPECELDCPHSHGNIKIDGTTIYSWNAYSELPWDDSESVVSGATITITAEAYSSGQGCADVSPLLSIFVNSVECAYTGTEFDPITCTFTLTANTIVEVSTGCLIQSD